MPHDEKNNQVEGATTPYNAQPASSLHAPQQKKGSDGSLLRYMVIAIGVALIVRFFIAAPYLVSGPSMEHTFQNHDYLIVDRFSYGVCTPAISFLGLNAHCMPVGNPERGDVVIFKLPTNMGETLIKRVIGLPGDTVTVSASGVTIANAANPKGFKLSEPYIAPDKAGGVTGMTVTLAPDHYFVLGDNRRVSYDSRSWGTLPGENIIGRVIVRLYPFSTFGFFPGETRYTSL